RYLHSFPTRRLPISSANDLVLFSYVRLSYPRLYRAGNDALSFPVRSTQSATVDGFTTLNLRVLDISDPSAVQEVRTIAGTGASRSEEHTSELQSRFD